ncbi:MAG: hypothetical protein WD401_07370, partial [Thermomicrobiaceae bacterium]
YEAAGGGVDFSSDAGGTWTTADDGMDRHYVWALAVDPEDPDRWFVSASHSARYAHRDDESSEAIIYRKIGDQPWQALTEGLDPPMQEMPYALLIPQDDPEAVYAGTRQGSLYISCDRGDTWHKTNVELYGILQLAYAG